MKTKMFIALAVLSVVGLLSVFLRPHDSAIDSGKPVNVEAHQISMASFASSRPPPLSPREKAKKRLGWLSTSVSAESLFDAAAEKQYYIAGLLLDAGIDINAIDEEGRTPLLTAILWKDVKMVTQLLDRGADVNLAGEGYPRPIQVAFSQNDLPLMKMLIKRGANVNETDGNGRSLLSEAVASGNTEALELLLRSGASWKASKPDIDSPLHVALRRGHSDIAKTFFKLERANRKEWTPFMKEVFAKALRTSDMNMAALLIAHHSEFPKLRGAKQSLLAYSLVRNNIGWFRMLLDLGADPNERLVIPAEQKFISAVNDDKLAFYLRSEEGTNILMLAAGLGRIEFVRALLEKGADRNARTAKYKMVPLSFAQQNNKTRVILLLLGKDPDPTTHTTRVAISLSDQRAVFYQDGVPVLRTRVSTGKENYRTPTGEFVVTDKHRVRVSNIYDAEMPYFMRLNGSAVGMHAGHVPDYPASHGCIRLPHDAARRLYRELEVGTYVTISD